MSRLNLLVLFFVLFLSPLQALVYETPLVLLKKDSDAFLFSVNVPRTEAQKDRGLMGVKDLKPHQGMLFHVPKRRCALMWMKNTPLSLDMLFLNEMRKVVFIAPQTKPFSTKTIQPPKTVKNVRYVLEVHGGTCKRLGIDVGDVMFLPKRP